MNFRKLAVAAGVGATLLASVVAGAAPASAASPGGKVHPMASFDCTTGSYGENNDGVWIYCSKALGGDARGRGDCVAAPDIYTDWVHTNGYSQNGFCLFSMRGTITETRIN
jgi:hypothetical protein